MRLQPLSFRWSPDFIQRIDKARGAMPRAAFCRNLIQVGLDLIDAQAAAGGASAETLVRDLAERYRDEKHAAGGYRERSGPRATSSSDAKAGVRPIPKAAKR